MIKRNITQAALALILAISPATLRADTFYNSWTQEYLRNADESQAAKAVAIDSLGNVIVTGWAQKPGAGQGGENTAYTVKYDGGDGHVIWERILSTTNDTTPTSVAVDSTDAVIITGIRNSSGIDDIFVMKYGSDGTPTTGFGTTANPAPVVYDGTAGGQDIASKVVIDSADNIIVVGRSIGASGGQEDFMILKFGPTGTLVNEERTNPNQRKDFATDVAIGPADSIAAVGTITNANGDPRLHIRKLNANFTSAFAAKTIDTGGRGGATGVAVDQTTGDIYTTGLFSEGTDQGYYTIKYSSTGVFQWQGIIAPTAGDASGTPTSIAVGPDGHPVVTGYLRTAAGDFIARTVKYASNSEGDTTGDELWNVVDTGFAAGETQTRKVLVDGANNVIVVGDSDAAHGPGNNSINKDLYVAKYDGATGERIFAAGFNGDASTFGFDDEADDPNALPFGNGVGLAVDPFGNIVIAGTAIRQHNDVDTSTGRSEIATLKFNRFIADKGDALPDTPPLVPDAATFFTGGAPAIADNGNVVAKITLAAGQARKSAIFTQGPAGGTVLVAVQGGDAPNGSGGTEGKWASFSDPIIAPNGDYAFAAKISGVPATKANGVWQSINGVIARVLQQGTPIAGLTGVNFVSVTNTAMRSGQLLVLGKVSGPGSMKTVLLGINGSGTPTLLARTGETMVTVGTDDPSVVTAIAVLSPSPGSAGDGRWQSTSAITTARLTLASGRSVIARITAGGTITPLYFDGQDATGVAASTYKSFGFPAISAGLRLTTLAKLQPAAGQVTSTTDTVLLYHTGAATSSYARKDGDAPADPELTDLKYAGFSNPVIGSNGVTPTVGFLATLKGSGVKPSNNRALIFGSPTGTLRKAGRTGGDAPAGATPPGEDPENPTKFKSFTAFAMPNGAAVGPVFVATLSGAGTTSKNNVGVFAVASDSSVTRLLRTGQRLGDRTIKTITLLKAVPKAMAAARSFNNAGSVVVALKFTNNETALLRVGIP